MSAKEMVHKEREIPQHVSSVEQEAVFLPDVDIVEAESEFRLIADMPGVDENSVDIDVDKNVLTVHGRFVPQPPEDYSLDYQEYSNGHYERSFTLGSTIDRDGIKAVISNGVLRLTLPKAKESQPRRIAVTAG